jgi:hypothetical protein
MLTRHLKLHLVNLSPVLEALRESGVYGWPNVWVILGIDFVFKAIGKKAQMCKSRLI